MARTGFFKNYVDNTLLSSWVNDPHTVYLVSDIWSYDTENSVSFNEIPPAAILGSASVTNRASSAGVLIADHVSFVNVQSGSPSTIVIVNDNTQELVIAFDDTNGLNSVSATETNLYWNECGIAAA